MLPDSAGNSTKKSVMFFSSFKVIKVSE